MAKSATMTTPEPAYSAEVSVMDFLARRRPVPHLFDLAPQLDPAAFDSAVGYAVGAPVYGLVRTKGERQTDVRLLVDDGERHLDLASALARNLRCDVYLTPYGAHLRYLRESSPVAGDSWDVIAVDRRTGEPAAWLVVRPTDLPSDVPTWFVTVRGRLRPSHGVVTVALPDGVAFATKSTFRDTTFLAATMRANPSRLTTLAVNGERGRFEISRFDDAGSLLGGAQFATLVAATLDVIHPDVQAALTWPADPTACAALDAELVQFAEALGRTVWVPQAQGAAFVLPGCGEFAAVDEVGSPSAWHAYPARPDAPWRPRYGTDLDGRLVPLGRTVATAFPGVPFVSVPRPQLDRLRSWYDSVPPCAGMFAIDLAVLADGRLGVLVEDGTPLAVGPRELRETLRGAGWAGEDLLLLTQPPAEYWGAAMAHVRTLANQLMVDVWYPALGADVWAQEDGTLAAAADDGERAWRVMRFGQPADRDDDIELTIPASLVVARPAPPRPSRPTPPTALRPGHASADLDLTAVLEPIGPLPLPGSGEGGVTNAIDPDPADPDPAGADPAGADPAGPGTDSGAGGLGSAVVGPAAATQPSTPGAGRSHAVPWLPPAPAVNHRAMEFYLWTPLTDDHIPSRGLPSADLFLLAGQDPLRVAEHCRDGCLLRLCAPPQTAIDLSEHTSDLPAELRERLAHPGVSHLLPLAWVADLRVTARFDLDGRGGIAARHDIDAGELAIRFEGAAHGVPGLPDDVVHWPAKGQRAGLACYLMLRDDTALDRIIHRGYVALTRRKPTLAEGSSLFEIKVHRRKAIDLPATLDRLGGLPVVGRPHDFVGLDLLLPKDDLPHAGVTRIWRYAATGRPSVERPAPGTTLASITS